MTAEVWTKVRELIEVAASLPHTERTAYLRAHAPDEEVRLEAMHLLEFEAEADGLFTAESPAWDLENIASEPGHVGEIVGSYRLLERIGRGGMGAVYRAERIDATYEKCVAVKLIDSPFLSADVIAHFRAERQILANLEHTNIARLLDGGARADGLPYLIMEYVDGISPYSFCREHDLSIPQRLLLFRQICSAVHFAHQHMVIHRDLKPANILVTEDGTPKLLDFGIAKVFSPASLEPAVDVTEPAMRRMTVRYASPEQVRGEPVTTASDVYSLGVILYELLAGHSPYGDDDRPTHQLMTAVCDEAPARPSLWVGKLKGDLDNIVLRALRKPPLERYASADQFSDDIRRYLEGRPVIARGDAPLYIVARFIHRNRVLVAAAALLLCSLVGGLIETNLARARADRRFNEVRQLAHSVMFDYADAIDRLPGATPVRARMVKDALTYLDNLSKEADTPQLQREVVNAYVHVSNVQGNEYENNLGDTAGAMVSAHKAVDEADKLLRKDRGLAAFDAAANAFSTYGSLLYSTGDLPAADRAYAQAISLRRQIAVNSPGDTENMVALSVSLQHMGDLYGGVGFQNLGRTAQALAFYEEAKTLSQRLAAQLPGNLDVAKESYKTLLSLSSAESAAGARDAAAGDLADALAQIRKVATAEPRDTNVKVELAVGESRLGQMLLDARNASAAILQLTASAGLMRDLLHADPGNAIYRRGQSVVETQWAAALRVAGQIPASVAHNQNALLLAQGLSRDAPNSVQYRLDVGTDQRKLSEGLLAAGDAAGALHQAEGAAHAFCVDGPASTDSNTLANCDRSLVAQGNAYLALGDSAPAVSALRQAVSIASARCQADGRNAVFGSDWARAQAALGAALAKTGDPEGARGMFQDALKSWSALRDRHALSAEDSFRSDATAQSLAALRPHP